MERTNHKPLYTFEVNMCIYKPNFAIPLDLSKIIERYPNNQQGDRHVELVDTCNDIRNKHFLHFYEFGGPWVKKCDIYKNVFKKEIGKPREFVSSRKLYTYFIYNTSCFTMFGKAPK